MPIYLIIAVLLQGIMATGTSATSSSPREPMARSLNEGVANTSSSSGEEHKGGFLSQAKLFGEPRQFTNDDSENSTTVLKQADPSSTTDELEESSVVTAENATASLTVAPTMTMMMDLYDPCPRGYICSRYRQESCESVRQIPISLGMGDIHAGLYCP